MELEKCMPVDIVRGLGAACSNSLFSYRGHGLAGRLARQALSITTANLPPTVLSTWR